MMNVSYFAARHIAHSAAAERSALLHFTIIRLPPRSCCICAVEQQQRRLSRSAEVTSQRETEREKSELQSSRSAIMFL